MILINPGGTLRAQASEAGFYVSFMGLSATTRRTFTGVFAINLSLQLEPQMDFVFIALGAGMFALFALYAVLLRRV